MCAPAAKSYWVMNIYYGPDAYITVVEATRIDIISDIVNSKGVTICTYDPHPIYDLRSGDRLNKSKSLKIGDHVWLGDDVLVMPGSMIRRGVVVGVRSLLTRKPTAFVAPDRFQYRDETREGYFDFVAAAPVPIFSRADHATAWFESSKNGNFAILKDTSICFCGSRRWKTV